MFETAKEVKGETPKAQTGTDLEAIGLSGGASPFITFSAVNRLTMGLVSGMI